MSTVSGLNDVQMAKKELLTHTDNKVNELNKTYVALKTDLMGQIQQVLDDKNKLENEMRDIKEKTLKELVTKSQLSTLQAGLFDL